MTDAPPPAPVWAFTVTCPRNRAPSARSPRTRISFHVLLSTETWVKPFMVTLLSWVNERIDAGPSESVGGWSRGRELNPRPTDYEGVAALQHFHSLERNRLIYRTSARRIFRIFRA